MFVYHNESRCYWFSTTQSGNLREYNLIGVVSLILLCLCVHGLTICVGIRFPFSQLTGLAVYNSIILDLHFPTACYKKLLSPPVVPMDLDCGSVGTFATTMDDFAEVMPVSPVPVTA